MRHFWVIFQPMVPYYFATVFTRGRQYAFRKAHKMWPRGYYDAEQEKLCNEKNKTENNGHEQEQAEILMNNG